MSNALDIVIGVTIVGVLLATILLMIRRGSSRYPAGDSSVYLWEAGASPDAVHSALMKIGFHEIEAQKIINGVPIEIKNGISEEAAREITVTLGAAGAKVEVR